jgi:hypothetical protein
LEIPGSYHVLKPAPKVKEFGGGGVRVPPPGNNVTEKVDEFTRLFTSRRGDAKSSPLR